MATPQETFEEIKRFVGFSSTDVENLTAVGDVFAKHGAAITNRFYEVLGTFPATAAQIDGRVEVLKATHGRWMAELFAGEYGESYLQGRLKIGLAHVRIGLDPSYVECVMSLIRAECLNAIVAEQGCNPTSMARYASVMKLLDIDLMLINLAYAEDRIERLSKFTGMNRRLIENVIKKGGK